MKSFFPICFALIMRTVVLGQSPVLWGLTSMGGSHGAGTLFSYNTLSCNFNVEHEFGNGMDGQSPRGSLIKANDGLLYGMTAYGGTSGSGQLYDGDGNLFSFNPITGTYTDLHDFGSNRQRDGAIPYGSLLQASDGLLYGLTLSSWTNGSYGSGVGVLFSYNIATGVFTVLQVVGSSPNGNLIQANNGLLYGMAEGGGFNGGNGTIFCYNPLTGNFRNLHDFGGSGDGALPAGSLLQASTGLLYGMTCGMPSPNQGEGVIFSYNPDSNAYQVLHYFDNGFTGGWPMGSFIQVNDTFLCALTSRGKTVNIAGLGDGTIIKFNLFTNDVMVLHDFESGSDGNEPYGDPVLARNGLIYGNTIEGGTAGGIIFSYNFLTGNEAVVADFDNSTGNAPFGNLLELIDTFAVNDSLNFTLAPNPSTGNFSTRIPDNETSITAKIYNSNGEKVWEQTLNETQNSINLINQAPGCYYVRLQTATSAATERLVIIK